MKRTLQRTYVLTRDEVREAVAMWLKAKDVPQPPLNDSSRVWVDVGTQVDDGYDIAVLYVHWNEAVDDEPKKK